MRETEREKAIMYSSKLSYFVTYPDDSCWLAWVIDIEVVDGAGEGDREKVRSLPQTADLLVLNLSPHLKLTATIKWHKDVRIERV